MNKDYTIFKNEVYPVYKLISDNKKILLLKSECKNRMGDLGWFGDVSYVYVSDIERAIDEGKTFEEANLIIYHDTYDEKSIPFLLVDGEAPVKITIVTHTTAIRAIPKEVKTIAWGFE